ncbi:polysaccharide deacetylase family protein [Peribacillus sp. SCS-155]|uniref:polysaccharide deacetylase family protein n=1 Tax=Peribacillus sedimenti TaxID=3115297 RepID=UPI0039069BDC
MRVFIATGYAMLLSTIGMVIFYAFEEKAFGTQKPLVSDGKPLGLEACKPLTRTFVNDGVNKAVPILTYHHVIKEEDLTKVHYESMGHLYQTIITAELFEEHLKFLKDNGYTSLSLEEFRRFMAGESDVPKKSVFLTIDDGFRNNYVEAYPLLKKYGFQATNFLITAKVLKQDVKYDASASQYLTFKEAKKACDVFEYQSHTFDYHKIGKKRSYLVEKPKGKIEKDIAKSIVQLDGEKGGFSYPYGQYDEETIQAVKDLGFEMAFTTEERPANRKDSMYEIPRYQIVPTMGVEDLRAIVEIH